MIPEPDWLDPAAVKRYKRKIVRRDLLFFSGAAFIGLLPLTAYLIYEWLNPEKAAQQRQRVRDRIKAKLDSPATKGDLLLVKLMFVVFAAWAMLMGGLHTW